MRRINKRLDDLERAADPVKGCVVLYCDLEGDGYWDQPFSEKDRRRKTEAERRELEQRHDVIVVKYVKDWRSVS